MSRARLALTICLLSASFASAQGTEELEVRLARQAGLERARTLATLTDLLRQDRPRDAITYGLEALTLFAAAPDPVNEVRTLNELAWAYMTLSEYADAVTYAERGRRVAEAHGDARGRARAVNNLGVIAQRRGDALQAVEHFDDALAQYRALGSDLEVATALNNLGFVYSTALADYETALGYHVEALTVRERLGDRSAVALSLNNIGIVYYRLGDLERALAHFERSLAIRRALGGDSRIASTLHNIGDVYYDRREYRKAMDFHAEALALRRRVGDHAGIAHSLRNLGVIHHALEDDRAARQHLSEALAKANAAGDDAVVIQARLGLALVERERGNAARAVAFARDALTRAQQLGNLELTRQSWDALAASQEAAGDVAAALSSFRKFHEANTRIFDAERSRRLELLDRRYQAERRESEIAQLRADQAASTLRLNQRAWVQNGVLAAAAAFALLGLALYRRRVESARMAERLSVTDPLTGLRNRRYLLQTIEADVSAVRRGYRDAPGQGRPSSTDLVFMLIDIDDFKAINDEFGHAAGDRVLTEVSRLLRASCRASDTVVRWGGEEFLVVFRFTARETAPISAERIRMAIEQHRCELGDGRVVGRTCSIGFAAFPPDRAHPDEGSWEDVVAAADEALYRAKQAGRNTWAGAGPTKANRTVA